MKTEHNANFKGQQGEDTEVTFDLANELGNEELEKFRESANGKSLTEHFLDVTIRNKESAA